MPRKLSNCRQSVREFYDNNLKYYCQIQFFFCRKLHKQPPHHWLGGRDLWFRDCLWLYLMVRIYRAFTTLSLIHQICSRWLRIYFVKKNWKISIIERMLLWLKVENIVVKGEIARFEQFLLLSLCFQKGCLLQRRQKGSIWGKGINAFQWLCNGRILKIV